MANTPPNASPISQFTEKELISAAALFSVGPVFKLAVPAWLPERRIYLYLEAKLSAAAAYNIFFRIRVYYAGRPVGDFPARICDFTGQTPPQSVASIFNAGGSPVGDSLVLRLAQPFDATVTAVVIQPLRINAQIDEIELCVDGQGGATLTGARAYLGVLSTLY
jgi:hypothetical protein